MVHSPGFLAIVNEAKERVKEVDIDGYKEILSAGELHLLIDIREDSEWAAGHAKSAIHIGKGVIERDIESRVPRKDTKLVLYCGGGYRSVLAADALGRMGYCDVLSLAGGWRAIKESGLPTE